MSNIVEIPKFEGKRVATPLTWSPVRLGDNTWTARLTCPNGHSGILEGHRVGADGIVRPSVVCPAEDCDWHVWVRLLDWDLETSHVDG